MNAALMALKREGAIQQAGRRQPYILTAADHRAARDHAFRTWREVAGVAPA